jgi:hypothetical protein
MKIHCTLLVSLLGVMLCSGVQAYRDVLICGTSCIMTIHEHGSVYVIAWPLHPGRSRVALMTMLIATNSKK